jgi:NAD(P)-dependent dehydrogenase (short-subunit alcohol dehydrogenase family)
VNRAFEDIRAAHGDADVLVYNGARWHERPAMELDPADFTWDLALCATGALVCAQAVYPAMAAAGRGTMLLTGGGLALNPQFGAGVASLTAGKSALRGLAYALAGELAPSGVHVATVTVAGTIQPGSPFDPDLIAERYWALHAEPRGSWSTEVAFTG